MKQLFSYLVDVPDEARLNRLGMDETEFARLSIGDGEAELYKVEDAQWAEEAT